MQTKPQNSSNKRGFGLLVELITLQHYAQAQAQSQLPDTALMWGAVRTISIL